MANLDEMLKNITRTPERREAGWFFDVQQGLLDSDKAKVEARTKELELYTDAMKSYYDSEAKKEAAREATKKAEQESKAAEAKAKLEKEAKEREARAIEIKASKDLEASVAAAEAKKFKAAEAAKAEKIKADGIMKAAAINADGAIKCEEIRSERDLKIAAIGATERVRIAELQSALFECPAEDCGYVCKDNATLKQHHAKFHSGGWRPQIQDGYGQHTIGLQPHNEYGFSQLAIRGPTGNNELALQRRGYWQ